MATVTATDLARRTNQVLDMLTRGESISITRNNTVLGIITPPARAVTLRDAFERLPRLSPGIAERYKADIRHDDFGDEVRDPWQR
ncbi:MAG: hypothetical protein LBQ09_11725 [Acidobacteriaceae bacterium]|jgi:antitoxin (DNA-binding transcriptional repressor) of toxin-antitoxin stability system|nr:hypothetical protein [Acidobacteriaceae bacterium]